MKDTLTKVLYAQPENSLNTASTIKLEDDQGYFGSYSSVDIHYEMLKVNNVVNILLRLFYSVYLKKLR